MTGSGDAVVRAPLRRSAVAPVRGFTTARLQPPRTSTMHLHRPRLVRRLEDDAAPVTLLSAPAGAGKTSLLASWVARLDATQRCAAWYGLDADDASPKRLLAGLLASLRAAPWLPADSRVRSFEPPAGEVGGFLDQLVGELEDAAETVWLVLDDVQLARSPAAASCIEELAIRMSDRLRLVLATRTDPPLGLARLRVDGRLRELRARELAFTRDELRDALAQHDLQLPDDALAALHDRTEGWAAGVRFAVLALQTSDDLPASIADFSGDDHAIADYLFAEVLAGMDAADREFLLATSVCDRVPVALARHLTGRDDAGPLLERLVRENVFTSRTRRGRTEYRYHEILRTFLQAELVRSAPARVRELHALIGAWYVETGDDLEAFSHLVDAGDTAALRTFLVARGLALVLDGDGGTVLDALDRAPAEARHDRCVALIAAAAATDLQQLERADRWLSAAGTAGTGEDGWLAALAATVELGRARLSGALLDALTRVEATDAGATGDGDLDALALHHRGVARLELGRYVPAIADLRAAGHVSAIEGHRALELTSVSFLGAAYASVGRLADAAATAERAIALAEVRGWGRSAGLANAHMMVAWYAHMRCQGARASHHLARALELLDRRIDPDLELAIRSVEVVVEAEGDARYEAVRRYHTAFLELLTSTIAPATLAFTIPDVVRTCLDIGERSLAIDLTAAALPSIAEPGEGALVRALLLLHAGRPAAAVAELAPVLRGDAACHVVTTEIRALLLAATIEEGRGNAPRAFERLRAALDVAQPQGIIRDFVADPAVRDLLIRNRGRFDRHEAFVADLLAVPSIDDMARTHDALTPAELEIVRDLPSLLSLREIAAARGVSPNTVKTHLRAIYRKLGVETRRAAVEAARHRGLV